MIRIWLILACVFLATSCADAQKAKQAPAAADGIFGDWAGESKCTGTNPSCHDEVVVYHLTRSKDDAAKVHVSADKIINGKPDNMGDFDFAFDQANMTLTTEFTMARGGKAVWQFKIDGDKMDGTLTDLPQNQVSRNVHLVRKKNEK